MSVQSAGKKIELLSNLIGAILRDNNPHHNGRLSAEMNSMIFELVMTDTPTAPVHPPCPTTIFDFPRGVQRTGTHFDAQPAPVKEQSPLDQSLNKPDEQPTLNEWIYAPKTSEKRARPVNFDTNIELAGCANAWGLSDLVGDVPERTLIDMIRKNVVERNTDNRPVLVPNDNCFDRIWDDCFEPAPTPSHRSAVESSESIAHMPQPTDSQIKDAAIKMVDQFKLLAQIIEEHPEKTYGECADMLIALEMAKNTPGTCELDHDHVKWIGIRGRPQRETREQTAETPNDEPNDLSLEISLMQDEIKKLGGHVKSHDESDESKESAEESHESVEDYSLESTDLDSSEELSGESIIGSGQQPTGFALGRLATMTENMFSGNY